MKRLKGLAALLLSLALLAGCAAAPAKEEREEGAFVAHGYLRGGAGVAQLDGALYAFLPKGEGPGAREYLYELNEDGGKGRIVCGKAGCAHEEQGTLLDPCHAYSHTVTGLMAADGALFAGSRNGAVGVTRFDPKGGPPETVLTSEKEIACFLVWDGDIYYAQQDQPFPAGGLTQGGGYRLMKRPLDAPDAPAEAIYAREGRGRGGVRAELRRALHRPGWEAPGRGAAQRRRHLDRPAAGSRRRERHRGGDHASALPGGGRGREPAGGQRRLDARRGPHAHRLQ